MTQTIPEDKIIVGRLGAPHGIKGALRLHSFTDPIDAIKAYTPLYLSAPQKGQWTIAEIEYIKQQGKQLLIGLFGISDRTQAAQMTHCELAIASSQLPILTAGEYYWHDLIGMTVVNTEKQVLGNVAELMETGANDVLVVKKTDADETCLIPFVLETYVLAIDKEAQCITVDWDVSY